MKRTGIFFGVLASAALLFVVILSPRDMQTRTQEQAMPDTREAVAAEQGRYFNERYGFSFSMPEGAVAHEHKEGQNSATVSIEKVEDELGFQIHIIPYVGEQIGEERFLADIPSGVRQKEEQIMVDGVPAVAFISEDVQLGQTREIWFLKNQYLYELTAPISSEIWLEEVLRTFKFEDIL